jgi:hypothetical protein
MDLFQLREQFSREGIMLCFNGPFSHSIIEEIGTAIRNHLSAEKMAPMSVQDVFAVYIEMAQNARNYLTTHELPPCHAAAATIVIARRNGCYVVTAGNVILTEDMRELCNRIDRINTLPDPELKRHIRQQLRSELPPGASGAGVGLMEIARRSSERLAYNIREIDERYGFLR